MIVRGIKKTLQIIYSVYGLVLFVGIMLALFPFFLLAVFFGRIRGGNIMYRLCVLWGDIWFFLIFFRIKRIYESPVDKKRTYIFVSNHNSYIDAAVLVKAYRQPTRPLGKIEMRRIPLFGFIYNYIVVTVDRASAQHRARSVRVLKSVLNKGISILVFPEGTFNMSTQPLKEFYDGAFRVAIETQTPVKPVLFLDTYDRLHHAQFLSLTPGKCRLVYLEEVPVAGLSLKDTVALKEKVFDIMSRKLIEYKASWID